MVSVTAATQTHPSSFLRALGPLVVLALVIAIGFASMGSFATVQESAKAELALSDTTLGAIQSVGAAVPLLLFSIPIGLLVDRFNRMRLTAVLALVWTAGTLLTALAPNAATLLVARMLTGIGTTGALTAILSLSADFCSPDQRGRAMLIVNLGKSLGIAAAFALSGWLFGVFTDGAKMHWFGALPAWRSTHFALALLTTPILLLMVLLREPPRREIESAPGAPFATLARELWARRAFLGPLFAGQVAVVMADAAAGVWVSPVLSRNYGLQPQDFGGWVGAVVFGAGIAGALLGGISADLGQKSRFQGGILMGAVIAAGLGVPAALFPMMPGVTSFAVALGALILCGATTGLVISVALTVLIPNELRGLCIGAFIAIAGLIGFGIAPNLVTGVSALLGGEHHLATALAIVGTSVSTLSFFAFILAMRRVPPNATEQPII